MFENTLSKLLKIISRNFQLNIFEKGRLDIHCSLEKSLLKVHNDHFEFVDREVFRLMSASKSRLADAFLDFRDIENLCKIIFRKSNSVDFNHLGFCYQVKSKNEEKTRLSGVAKNKGLYLYEIPSNDFASWLFVGDVSNPKDPIIEFLPVEKVNDYYLDYWLPHVHFALHTNLSADEIKYTVHKALKGNKSANPAAVVDNITYQSRIWLGTISGINFCLDFYINEPGNSLLETRQLLKTTK
jgi:hypothetical protein